MKYKGYEIKPHGNDGHGNYYYSAYTDSSICIGSWIALDEAKGVIDRYQECCVSKCKSPRRKELIV